MTAQELLDPLFNFISELKFNYSHRCVNVHPFDQKIADDYKHEILVKTMCNDLELTDFQKRVKELSREVEDSFEDNPQNLATAIKLVNRKLEDLFTVERKYMGNVESEYHPNISKHKINPAKEPYFGESELRDYHDSILLNQETEFPEGLGYKDIEIVAIKYNEPIDKYYEWIRLKLIDLIGTLNSQVTMLSNIPMATTVNEKRIKIKWLGHDIALGYLLYRLKDNGLIGLPLKSDKTINKSQTAEWMVNSFDFGKATPHKDALGKSLTKKVTDAKGNRRISEENYKLIMDIADAMTFYK